MTGGEKLLIVGAAGLGIVAILKFKQNNPSQISPPAGASNINPQFDMSGLGAAGPFGAPLAVLQPIVKGGVDKLNSSLGLNNPYAGLTKNADGTYTDGLGCIHTFGADGSHTRMCPAVNPKAAKGLIYFGKGVKAVGSAGAGIVKSFESIF